MHAQPVQPRPWRRAVAWLFLLGPFFSISYGFANTLASHRANVGSIVFEWEHAIPFLAWTIVPYWIIDAMYGLSLFVCQSKHELDTHAKRLFTAQVIAVSCFLLFPLSYNFVRPETQGIAGAMFNALTSFDKPYNQAPSLHIVLLIILWVKYLSHLPRYLHWPLHGLCILIGVSVLTTYQHHFIDIPTGMLAGWLCIWLWPETGRSPLRHMRLTRDTRRWRIAAYYFTSALLASILAVYINGLALWLLWPAVSLLLVASFYLIFGSNGFQKQPDGKLSAASSWLLWPYLAGAKINSRLWVRGNGWAVHIKDGVWLGRFPSRQELSTMNFKNVIDLTAELSAPSAAQRWHIIPNLDLLPPDKATLIKAADLIEQLQHEGPLLVSCALGYSRSVMAVVTWLLRTQRVPGLHEAIAHVRQLRPSLVMREQDQLIIAAASQQNTRAGVNDGK